MGGHRAAALTSTPFGGAYFYVSGEIRRRQKTYSVAFSEVVDNLQGLERFLIDFATNSLFSESIESWFDKGLRPGYFELIDVSVGKCGHVSGCRIHIFS